MASKNETLYTAIDVGTTKVATLVARVRTSGSMEIVAVGRVDSEGMRKGLVVSPDQLGESVRQSVEDAAFMLGRKLPPAFVGITGAHLSCLNTDAGVTHSRKGGAVTQDDIDRFVQSVAPEVPTRRRVVHVLPQSFTLDGRTGVRNPIGLTGNELTASSHVVFGDPAHMENLTRVVRAAGVKVRGVIMEHLASAEAVLTAGEREMGVVLVDIGGGTSDIAIYRGGAVCYTAAIPVAGHQFTNDVAVGLGLTPGAAEEAKVQYGSVLLDEVDRNEMLEVAMPDGQVHDVPRMAFTTLLRDRGVELVRLILLKVLESGLDRVPPGGIVLTGGAANLHGMAEIAADYGRCAVRVGSPSAALGLPQELVEARYTTSVGLLLWGIQHQHAGAVADQVEVSVPVMDKLRGWLSHFSWKRPRQLQT